MPESKEFLQGLPKIDNIFQWIQIALAILTFAIFVQTTYFKDKTQDEDKYKEKFIEHLLNENQQLKKQKTVKGNKIPRNELCPCGSGIKYKKCCYLTKGIKLTKA